MPRNDRHLTLEQLSAAIESGEIDTTDWFNRQG